MVHDETALRMASPGVTNRRLRLAFNRVLAGEEDIIDLAFQADVLFAPDADQPTRQGHAAERPDRKAALSKPTDYATPEEFRRAAAQRAATGVGIAFISNSFLVQCPRSQPHWRRLPV
jgi:hypothetical protein